MNKNIITLIGFILFILGFLSFVLMLVGLQLKPLAFLTHLSTGWALIVRLIMLFGGLILIYLSKMPKEE